jgi:membrane protein implicated in regulation of membrane protease activity
MITLLKTLFTPNLPIGNAGYIWIFIALALLFAEVGTPGLFFFIAFAIGSVVASILAFFGGTLFVQCTAALIVSVCSFFFIRRLLKKRQLSDVKYESSQTNIDALVGKHAVVVTKFDAEGRGRVKVGGEEWASKLEGTLLRQGSEGLKEAVAKGDRVVIVGVRGNHLFVIKENK